jgi:hypothetical protein
MVPPSANQMPILAGRHWVWRELQHGQHAAGAILLKAFGLKIGRDGASPPVGYLKR